MKDRTILLTYFALYFSFDVFVPRTVHMQDGNKTADESYVNSCRVPRVIARWMPFEHCIGRLILCFKIRKVCYYKE